MLPLENHAAQALLLPLCVSHTSVRGQLVSCGFIEAR